MNRILVIDDDIELCELLTDYLSPEGFEVETVNDGERGAERALTGGHGLVILDVMLPGMNGFDVLRKIRERSKIPVIMLTARAQTEDRIQGLEAGADDYLVKPFSPKELVLRVKAVLKRSESGPGSVEYIHGPFRFDKNSLRFYLDDEPVDLTSIEFKLLLYLAERPGVTQQRDKLLVSVWGYSDEVHSRTLDTHMKRLRQKLVGHSSLVETVRGVGYRVAEVVA